MHSVQEYCKRLPTEKLKMLLRDHESGRCEQCEEIVELVKQILHERGEDM